MSPLVEQFETEGLWFGHPIWINEYRSSKIKCSWMQDERCCADKVNDHKFIIQFSNGSHDATNMVNRHCTLLEYTWSVCVPKPANRCLVAAKTGGVSVTIAQRTINTESCKC